MRLEAKVVIAAIASILTPLAATVLPTVDVSAIDAVVVGVVSLAVTFAAGYLTPHTERPDLPAKN
ncbi:hypothetical protein [Nocardiopsis sp. NRRL B-16309]|uniref:hypothetical protein n=1 Tax=Nocardiopsis sp. NRRL B-16309 TaxID=1519494 RepID=UPI0006ADCB00|nr:hypothetical protein [Nocardiopsis sp. NRRL B-16309]KOX10155.1 hypothetical protein ADL05_26125 [Nocardiopsis sp. NRRL B-16309]